jgi:hypothetical protein
MAAHSVPEIRDVVAAVAPSEDILPLVVIAVMRTGGDPEAEGETWAGAWAVSESLHGDVPVAFEDQAKQAAGILQAQKRITGVDTSGLVWLAPGDPIYRLDSDGIETGQPVKNSQALEKAIERAATISLGWWAPADLAAAVAFSARLQKPVAFEDIAVSMSWRYPTDGHLDTADMVVRDHPDLWAERVPEIRDDQPGTDWSEVGKWAGGVAVAAGAIYVLGRAIR